MPVPVRLRPRTVSMPAVARDVRQTDHEADRQQRRRHLHARVGLNRRDNLARRAIPPSNAATSAGDKDNGAGNAEKFRSTVASSGVGFGATGGIFRTAWCKHGIGILSAAKFRYFAIDGRPVTKIKTEATMKGDQPLNTCGAEWRCRWQRSSSPARRGSRSAGFQNLQKRHRHQQRKDRRDDVHKADVLVVRPVELHCRRTKVR